MAIAFVQQTSSNGAGMTSGGDPLVLGAAPTNGNILICVAEENDDSTGPTLAGTGVTWTKQNRFRGDISHDNTTLWTGVVGASASATQTITYHSAPSTGIWGAVMVEFSGVGLVDGTIVTPTNVVSASPAVTSNAASVTGDLVYSTCGHPNTTAPTATPPGFTALTRVGTNVGLEHAWRTNPGTSAVTATWTFAASTNALLQILQMKAATATPFLAAREPIVNVSEKRASSF